MSNSYLERNALYEPFIQPKPNPNLGLVVVIPCFNEKDLIKTLDSLYLTNPVSCAVEIIVLINDGIHHNDEIKTQNRSTFENARSWSAQHSSEKKQFYISYHSDLPRKKAGVGLARKIGMDEAVRRLESANNPNGVIVGFDADSVCETNYFQAIYTHFQTFEKVQAASIHYEHPLDGINGKEIAEYELHLRYFTLAKRWANYPHAFETIGSSMAVRSNAYQGQGGMNTRKAGEDFYFLNKFMVLGKLNECFTTKVIPSARVSDRVPFGTGKAVGDMLKSGASLTTYAPASFQDLKVLTTRVPDLYTSKNFKDVELPPSVIAFLETTDANTRISEIKKNTTNLETFEKRFYRWFDPFMVMKFVHFLRDHFYPNVEVTIAGGWVLKHHFGVDIEGQEKELLKAIRKYVVS